MVNVFQYFSVNIIVLHRFQCDVRLTETIKSTLTGGFYIVLFPSHNDCCVC